MRTNVLLLSKYDCLGASSRLRSYQYIPYLEREGIRVRSLPLFGREYIQDLYSGRGRSRMRVLSAYLRRLGDLLRIPGNDLIWVEKEIFPWLPAFAERALRRADIPYAVDYDDAIFHNYDRNRSCLVRTVLGRKIDKVMERAQLVIAGNDYLAGRAEEARARRIEVIPTSVDLSRYPLSRKPQQGRFRIGWIGTPVTSKYLGMVKVAIEKVNERFPVKLVLVGAETADCGKVPVEYLPWEESTEASAIADFDAGIMPLPDEPWERGKCGYKLIQYMACAKPVVASPVGANTAIVENGVNGYLASSQEEWERALVSLIIDPEARERMGLKGREIVERKYSMQASAPRLAKALVEAAGSK